MSKIRTLQDACNSKGILIATHRGMVCGNIPHNTYPAFNAALFHGTDLLETDITLTADGVPVVFHPGQEWNQFGLDVHVDQMPLSQVQELRYLNDCRAATAWGIPTLDEFLETYKNRCLINLDHAWHYLAPVLESVRRHGMEDQILMKAPGSLEFARAMEQLAPDMMFMPIIKEKDTITEALEQMDLNFVGAELVFAREDSELVSPAYLAMHHAKGRVLWCNAILYNYQVPLSGGHSDDAAATGDPDYGWGWIAEKGFDIIQTDWTMPLDLYLRSKGYRK